MVISAKHSSNGNYFLKVKVTYENEITESNITTLKYNVEYKGIVLFLSLCDTLYRNLICFLF